MDHGLDLDQLHPPQTRPITIPTHGPVRIADDMHEEDSTRLGDQDKDSSPPTYSIRTLGILGLRYII